jgi:hypothetical protein
MHTSTDVEISAAPDRAGLKLGRRARPDDMADHLHRSGAMRPDVEAHLPPRQQVLCFTARVLRR